MATYYVSTRGSNSDSGSENSPWRTISKATKADLKPGDEVVVKSGTYNEAVIVNKDGKIGDYITIRSEVPGGAKIDPPGNKPGITIIADYVKVDGFDVSGSQSSGITGSSAHHVEVTNNIVHDNVANGIYLGKADFLLVEGNVVYENAAKGGSSGIHLKAAYNITGSSSTSEYRIIVRDNVSYENKTEYGPRTDGNGISLDDFRNTQIPSLPEYAFKTLVEDNVVYSNTGRGIQVAWSDYATIRDNISIHNNADSRPGPWLSELVNMGSHDNTWIGNIAITDAGNPAIANVTFSGDPANRNITWHDNTTFNGTWGADSIYANAGNSTPTSANGNRLGSDPGLSLSEIKAIGASLSRSDATTALVRADAKNVTANGDAEIDTVKDASVRVNGTAGRDKLVGSAGSDKLVGHNGADHLNGNAGSDILVGGAGVDTMVGGAGFDTFVFRHTSTARNGDVIKDFSRGQGDVIGFGGIDADTNVAGNQSFSFIGSKRFSGDAGELQYRHGKIAGDVNGDKKADFHIDIANDHGLVADDFIL